MLAATYRESGNAWQPSGLLNEPSGQREVASIPHSRLVAGRPRTTAGTGGHTTNWPRNRAPGNAGVVGSSLGSPSIRKLRCSKLDAATVLVASAGEILGQTASIIQRLFLVISLSPETSRHPLGRLLPLVLGHRDLLM